MIHPFSLQNIHTHVKISPLFDSFPKFFVARSMVVSSHFLGTATHKHGAIGGVSVGFNKDIIRIKSFAEMVERASSKICGIEAQGLTSSSMNKLQENKISHLDINSYLGRNIYSEKYINRDHSIDWISGNNLLDNRSAIFLPALLSFHQWRPNGEIFHHTSSTGLAAHINLDSAITNSLLELIERDQCIMAWRCYDWPITKISFRPEDQYLELLDHLDLDYTFYNVSTYSGIYVIQCLLSKKDATHVTIGTSADTNGLLACIKALNESLMLRYTMKKFVKEFTPSPKSTLEHLSNAYLYSSDIINHLKDRPYEISSLKNNNTSLDEIVKIISGKTKNSLIAYVDVTDKAAKEENWFVVRSFVGGLVDKETSYDDFDKNHYNYSSYSNLNILPHPYG
jgi:thiazole/oxazole-forming peptide maturase SagD family component